MMSQYLITPQKTSTKSSEARTIISDSSCIILFEKIGELNLLKKLFGEINITKVISEEYQKTIPSWIKIRIPDDIIFRKFLRMNLDEGEASALALSIDLNNSVLILDDLKGRKTAEKLGIDFIGSLGIILEAKSHGIIPKIRPLIRKIKSTNFRLSEELERRIYIKARE